MVLPDPEEGDTDLVGELPLLDEVAERLRVRQRRSVGAGGDVTEGIEPQFDRVCHV